MVMFPKLIISVRVSAWNFPPSESGPAQQPPPAPRGRGARRGVVRKDL